MAVGDRFFIGSVTLGVTLPRVPCAALSCRMGKFQAHRMRDDWIPYEGFGATEHYQVHDTGLGIIDRLGSAPHYSLAEVKLAAQIPSTARPKIVRVVALT